MKFLDIFKTGNRTKTTAVIAGIVGLVLKGSTDGIYALPVGTEQVLEGLMYVLGTAGAIFLKAGIDRKK